MTRYELPVDQLKISVTINPNGDTLDVTTVCLGCSKVYRNVKGVYFPSIATIMQDLNSQAQTVYKDMQKIKVFETDPYGR